MAKQQRGNRFRGMTQALKGEILPEQEAIEAETPESEPEVTTPEPAPTPAPTPTPAPEPRRTRAKGKRSDPSYIQVGAYIPKALNKDVKRKLVDTEQDFSELVTQLLAQWVQEADGD